MIFITGRAFTVLPFLVFYHNLQYFTIQHEETWSKLNMYFRKLSESFELFDSKYWTNWQGVLNKLAESFEISENRIFCQILLEIGSFLHQNFTNCSIFADSLYELKISVKIYTNSGKWHYKRGWNQFNP